MAEQKHGVDLLTFLADSNQRMRDIWYTLRMIRCRHALIRKKTSEKVCYVALPSSDSFLELKPSSCKNSKSRVCLSFAEYVEGHEGILPCGHTLQRPAKGGELKGGQERADLLDKN